MHHVTPNVNPYRYSDVLCKPCFTPKINYAGHLHNYRGDLDVILFQIHVFQTVNHLANLNFLLLYTCNFHGYRLFVYPSNYGMNYNLICKAYKHACKVQVHALVLQISWHLASNIIPGEIRLGH